MRANPVLLLSVLLALPACSSRERTPSEVVVRDSAGIRIVENSLGLLDSAPEWFVSPTPTLKVGVLAGEEPFQFHRVRDAVLLQGLIWVLDGGSCELRAFRLDGSHVKTVGRVGEGPGEFTVPVRLTVLEPDTLLVWDQRLQRFSYFDPDGTFLKSVLIRDDILNPEFISASEDGSFLFSSFRAPYPTGDGIASTVLSVLHFGAEGRFTDTVGVFPYIKMKRLERPIPPALVLYSSLTWVSGGRRTFWVGTGEELEIQERSPIGRLVRIVRWEGPDRKVRPEHVEASYSRRLEGAQTEEARRRVRVARDQVPVADEFPSLADLVVDRVGRIWVRRYPRPTEEGPDLWVVFDGNGEIMAKIRLPSNFRYQDLGEDYVTGVITGEYDEEYIVLYEIQAGESGG